MLLNSSLVDNPDDVLIVFTGINNAKFRKSVVPGDQLKMEVHLANQRRNFITMKGKAMVEDQVVCELEASSAIVPREQA